MDTECVTAEALALGASKVRVADLALLSGIETSPPDLLAPYTRAVSLAIALDAGPLADIVDGPTRSYADHYRAVNVRLTRLVEGLAALFTGHGYTALALRPTTEHFDRVRCLDQLSHKAVAVAAGIGWQGKSLVTVSPEYGPRIRLGTVLTDAPLAPHGPIKNRCAGCTACVEACPAGAIKGASTDGHYASRDEALHFERCRRLLMEEFAARPGINASICGVCVAVCPWGRRHSRLSGR